MAGIEPRNQERRLDPTKATLARIGGYLLRRQKETIFRPLTLWGSFSKPASGFLTPRCTRQNSPCSADACFNTLISSDGRLALAADRREASRGDQCT